MSLGNIWMIAAVVVATEGFAFIAASGRLPARRLCTIVRVNALVGFGGLTALTLLWGIHGRQSTTAGWPLVVSAAICVILAIIAAIADGHRRSVTRKGTAPH